MRLTILTLSQMKARSLVRFCTGKSPAFCTSNIFCILPEMRNRHYGQKILAHLQEKPLILEIDPPIDDISRRRKGFYERCGFVENPYRHIHPPYHAGNAGHDLVIMSSPEMLAQTEYDRFAHDLRETVMKNAY